MKDEVLTDHPAVEDLRTLITGMCYHPCKVAAENRDGKLFIIALPHMADFRIVCGKSGRTIEALRLIAAVLAWNTDRTLCDVELEESYTGSKDDDNGGFQQNPEFDCEEAATFVRRLARTIFQRDVEVTWDQNVDKLFVQVSVTKPDDLTKLAALNDVFYPWGFRQGVILKITGPRKTKEAKGESR